MKCPKCNLKVSKDDKKCPFCETEIKIIEDTIEKLPEIIKEPEKITKSENLEKTKKLKIKPIPLEVKKPKKAKEAPDYEPTIEIPKLKIAEEEKEAEVKKTTIMSNMKIAIAALILLLNAGLIVITIIQNDNPYKDSTTNKDIGKVEKGPSKIIGNFRSANNGLFMFQDNKTFYWFDSYLNQVDNYYKGNYNYKKGKEALIEMGYTEEEFKKTFGTDINLDTVYSMNLVPSFVKKAGEDVTTRELTENESWWFILIMTNDNHAIAYNKTLDIRYNLLKIKTE